MLCLVLQCYRALKHDIFSKVLLEAKVYHLEQSNKVAKIRNRYNQVPHLTQDTLFHCKDYIVAVTK